MVPSMRKLKVVDKPPRPALPSYVAKPTVTSDRSGTTIDETHSEMLLKFRDIEMSVIPQLCEEIRVLKLSAKELSPDRLDKFLDIRDRVRAIRAQIRDLRSNKDKYFLDNASYIFDYFEHKRNVSRGEIKQNSLILNTFFKVKSCTPDIEPDIQNKSKNLYQKYWKNVVNELVDMKNFVVAADVCEYCRKGELIAQDDEGVLICNNSQCGIFIPHIVDSSRPTNKEPPNEISYTAYVRLNHFKEILSQFQAKETTQIPTHVIDAIRARLRKDRITDTNALTYAKMREILRKLKFNKYFEHIQYINSIFGVKPPKMSEKLHETMCFLFVEIQNPWALHCPAHRTNFFNYTYTLYQLCVLLDQRQYLPYISQLKDVDKQREQDQIWKNVCADLNWKFFPTA
jgi:hypothetical protein